MKCGPQIALAVGAGYLLGRHHKLRMALGLAAAGATGKLGASGSDLLQQGLKLLGSSPELEKIVNSVRGELFEVGKSAARAAAGKQIDTLTSKLHNRVESLRVPGGAGGEEEEEEEPTRGRKGGKGGKARAARPEPEDEDEDYEEEPEEEEEEEEEEEPAPARGRRATGGRSRPAAKTRPAPEEDEEEEEEDEEEEDEEEEEEEPPAKSARRRGGAQREKAAAGSRPVRRARG